MTKRNVRLVAAELHFYLADGWTVDNLTPLVDSGRIQLCGGFLRLAHTPSPACFNVDKLTNAVGDVLDHRLQPMLPREREVHLRYSSQHGVYLRGMDVNWRRKND